MQGANITLPHNILLIWCMQFREEKKWCFAQCSRNHVNKKCNRIREFASLTGNVTFWNTKKVASCPPFFLQTSGLRTCTAWTRWPARGGGAWASSSASWTCARISSSLARHLPVMHIVHANHRRRIKTEEKAKVVAAVWGTELIQFLATLDIFYQDDFEKKDEYRLLGRRDALKKLRIILFTSYQTTTLPKWMFSQKLLFKSSLLLNSKCGIQVYIPKQKRWPFPSLLSLSFFYDAISCSYTQN